MDLKENNLEFIEVKQTIFVGTAPEAIIVILIYI